MDRRGRCHLGPRDYWPRDDLIMAAPHPALVAGPIGRTLRRVLAAAGGVEALGAVWQRQLDGAVTRWRAEVSPAQQRAAEPQIEHAVTAQNVDLLATLAVPVLGADLLAEAMRTMALAGMRSVVAEAKSQGADLPSQPPLAAVSLADWAGLAAETIASGYAASVAREAARLFRPGVAARDVVDGVRTYLGGLTDRSLRDVIGGALTRAQNLGRLQVYSGPRPARWTVQLLADERLDSNTCKPCRKIDGTVLPTIEAAGVAYGGAGYLWCEGRERCRGTVTGVWTNEDAERENAAADLDPLGGLAGLLNRAYQRDSKGRFGHGGGAGPSPVELIRELNATVAEAKQLSDDDGGWHQVSGGASGAGTRMAVLPSGKRVVHKKAPDWGSGEPKTQADAEDLAGLTGMLLGSDTATVQRDSDDSVWIEHVPGKTLAEAENSAGPELAAFNAFRGSNAGARMGLLDVLIGNGDRNDGNIVIGEHGVIGIDHGFAFEMVGYERGAPHPQDLGRMGGDHAPARRFIKTDDNGKNHWISNPMTPGDVAETRRRLEILRPAYEQRGRTKWLDNAFAMLDQLAEHATGTESIYGD